MVTEKIENSENKDVPSFKKLLNREIINFEIMGMPSMRGIFSPGKRNTRWWEGVLIYTTIIILDTIEIFQVNAMLQIYNEKLDDAIELFGLTCSGVLSTIKIIRLWFYRAELFALLQKLGAMWEFARSQNLVTRKIRDIADHTRKMTYYYSMILLVAIIDFITHPYISIISYQFDKEINSSFDFSVMVLPVDYWFTIDSYSVYFLCITHQQLAAIISVISWVASDTLFAQLTTHVSLQLRVLANNLEKMINDTGNLNNNEIGKHLEKFVVEYQQLYTYCTLIEALFNPIIFFTVLSNGMNLCTSMYRLDKELTAGNWGEVSKHILYIISVSLQTAVFCVFAEDLSESSVMISNQIYQSQWTNCDQKSKMTLLIIIIRAQREFKCTAYGLINLNHNQLKQIANAAVSYFMLLRNLS